MPTVRLAALQGFAKRDDDTFLTVLSGLDPDPHWSVRAGLATILGSKDPERSLPRLTPMLADADARVVPSVLTAMTKLKAPGLAKILFEHLAKEDVGIRSAAATNIGELKARGRCRCARRGLQARRSRSRHRHARGRARGALEIWRRRGAADAADRPRRQGLGGAGESGRAAEGARSDHRDGARDHGRRRWPARSATRIRR